MKTDNINRFVKKLVSILLAFLMFLSVSVAVPVTVSAKNNEETSSVSEEKTTDQENTDESFEIESDDVTEPSKAETAEPETTEPETQKPKTTKKKAVSATGSKVYQVGDFELQYYEGNFTLMNYSGNAPHLTIPEEFEVDDYDAPVQLRAIGPNAFSNNSYIHSVAIPSDHIRRIHSHAFSDNDNIERVMIENGSVIIDDEAFYNNNTPEFVPTGHGYVPAEELDDFSPTPMIIYGRGGSKVEAYAKANGLEFKPFYEFSLDENNKTATLVKYNELELKRETVSVPEPNGYTVTAIGDGVFKECSASKVFFPDSVTSIGNEAFYDCTKLDTINSISVCCADLGTIKRIGDNAFYGCTSLASSNLVGCMYLRNLENAGRDAFRNCGVRNVYFSDRHTDEVNNCLTSISSGMFRGCSNITRITLPKSIQSIGDNAFLGCTKLRKVTISAIGNLIRIGNGSFKNCSKLIYMYIPESVISLGNEAFSGCAELNDVTIFNHNISIGVSAFSDCKKITVYGGNDSTTRIYASDNSVSFTPFFNCYFDDNGKKVATLTRGFKQSGNVTIPSEFEGYTVIEIGEFAFASGDEDFYTEDYADIKSITIPDSVTSIGQYAFRGCSGLTSITIPSGVTSIGQYAFRDCSGLTSITIPSGVTSIGQYAFANCSGLISVSIPDSVMSIGEHAFAYCSGLTSVSIPDSVMSIGEYAFAASGSISGMNVTIGKGLTNLSDNIFLRCNIDKITIPDNISRIGNYAFFECNIEELRIEPSHKSVTIFRHTFERATVEKLYVPANVDDIQDCDVISSVLSGDFNTVYTEIPSVWYDAANKKGCSVVEYPNTGFYYKESGDTYKYKKYTDSLEEAWEEATSADEGVVGLFDDVTISSTLVVPKDKKITLELNGHILDRGLSGDSAANNGNVITVSEGAVLNIYGGKESVPEPESEKTVSVWNSDGTTRTEKISNKGVITGGYSSTDGGGIKVEKEGSLNLYYTAVSGNRTNTIGGGIALVGDEAKLSINDNSEISCNCAGFGGGVGVADVENAVITTQTLEYVDSFNDEENSEGKEAENKITRNVALQNGGGVYIGGDYCEVSGNTVILDNTSLENGGGLCVVGKYLDTSGEIKITGNTANNNGGGVYVSSDICKMTGEVEISGNSAQQNGGGMYTNFAKGLFKFTEGTVKNNTAVNGKGGGIYNGKSSNRYYNITVTDNTAGSDGDGVYTSADIGLYKECLIFDNDTNGSSENLYLGYTSGGGSYIDDSLSGDSIIYVTYGTDSETSEEHLTRLTKTPGYHDVEMFFYDKNGTYHFEYMPLSSDCEDKGHIVRVNGIETDSDTTEYTEGNYQYTVSKGKATITKYIGSAKKVIIPSTLGGYPVTSIGARDVENEKAYKDGKYVRAKKDWYYSDVILTGSNYTSSSRTGAFEDNETITSITIPGCVKVIGFNAFRNCSKLTNVTISDGVEKIWTKAFAGCDSFHILVLPESIKFIAHDAFWYGGIEAANSTDDGITSLTMYTNFKFDWSNLPNRTVKHLTISDGSEKIPEHAFQNFYKLEHVNIPNNITEIGDYAFANCNRLTGMHPEDGNYGNMTLEIPRTVWYIGDHAFNGCWREVGTGEYDSHGFEITEPEGIKEVILHRGLTHIGNYAFYDCQALNHLMLPKTLSYLGVGALSSCYKLEQLSIPPGLVVPYDALPSCLKVLKLYAGAHLNLGAFGGIIRSVDINLMNKEYLYGRDGVLGPAEECPEDLPTITHYPVDDERDFSGLTTSLVVKCDLTATVAGYHAFGALYSIGEGRIDHIAIVCRKLAPMRGYALSNGYEWIGGDIDDFTDEDSEVETNPMKRDFNTFMGILSAIGASPGDVLGYMGSEVDLTLPESIGDSLLTRIAANAFSDLDITSIRIPNSFTEIKEYAFSGCKKLTKAAIEEGLKEIGSYAFENCSELVDIDLPESLTDLGNAVFEGCSALKDIELPDGIKVLGSELFSNCLSLKDIKLPSDLKTIGDKAFSACKNLTDIELPSTLTELKDSVFKDCIKLKNIELPDGVKDLGNAVFSGCTSLTDIELPDSITRLGDSMFENCKSLTRVELPSGITSIGFHMFSDCTSVTDIEIPDGVTSIGEKAFSNCSSLTSITIPDSVTSIAANAFEGCTSLREINLPEGLTRLGEAAFKDCKNIMSDINIPDSVKQIGEKAFYGCSNIKNIELPEELTSIGDSAFKGCSKLTSIEIPNGVTSIGGEVFSGCSNMLYAVIPASVKSMGSTLVAHDTLFENCGKVTIYCPVGSYMADNLSYGPPVVTYTLSDESAEIKRRIAFNYGITRIVVPSAIEGYTVKSISENAFGGFVDFSSISLPDTIISIGDKAFNGCTGLTSITIPDSVESIGDNAFYGCSKMTSIALPDSLTNIGDNAFKSCSKLTSVSIPDSVEAIGASAFSGCSQIKDLDLSATVQSLGESAFANCTNIETVFLRGRSTEISETAFNNCTNLKTFYGYDSSYADAYAKSNDISFVPLFRTNTGNGYKDVPLTDTQSVLSDGNGFDLNKSEYFNSELLGVQVKAASNNSKDIRFVAVINEGIVGDATAQHDIEDYGFVVAGCSNISTEAEGESNIQKVTVDSPDVKTLSCRKTSNNLCGDYGIYNKSTKYKYVTLAVNNVNPNQGFVVRFYIKTKSGRVYYSTYKTGYTGCAASYNRIATFREGENSVIFDDDWTDLSTFREN